MSEKKLHQAVSQAVSAIFGRRPHRVELDDTHSLPVATVIYQDYLSPATLHHTLMSSCNLPVEWNIERTMSMAMRLRLLEELYYQPEALSDNPQYRNNVRFYLFDRFATTDFIQSEDVNVI